MSPKKTQSKTPRLDPKDRLLKRFYEPLVLLHVLDPNGEQRTPRALDVTDTSVTAMALEAQPSGAVYWVASNSGVSTRTTVSFKESIALSKALLCVELSLLGVLSPQILLYHMRSTTRR
jgi:hypothetical protein